MSSNRPEGRIIDTATLELLTSWQKEDATADPAQVSAAEWALAEFKKNMNDARAASGEMLLYP